MKRTAAAALLLVVSCAPADAPPDTALPDTITADTLPGDVPPAPPADPVVERFRARVPPAALVRRGACPFECCVYGEWTAESDVPLQAQERGRAAPAGVIPAGQTFRADSGTVHITGLMVVAVEDSVGDPPYWSFAPGDTLVVLDYVGEGRYNVWHEGRIQVAEGFWGVGAPVGNATTYGQWASEWWVHATLPDGRTGWFHSTPPLRFKGADACG